MRKSTLVYVLVAGLALAGCGGEQQPVPTSQNSAAPQAPEAAPPAVEPESQPAAPPAVEHFYSLKDGTEYGYQHAISEEQEKQGQVAEKITMFQFAGEKDGKYQVFTKEKSVYQVIECDKECKFIKLMTFASGQHVNTERIAGGNSSIASIVLQDAINGQLEQTVITSKADGSKSHIWFSEESGISYTPVSN